MLFSPFQILHVAVSRLCRLSEFSLTGPQKFITNLANHATCSTTSVYMWSALFPIGNQSHIRQLQFAMLSVKTYYSKQCR